MVAQIDTYLAVISALSLAFALGMSVRNHALHIVFDFDYFQNVHRDFWETFDRWTSMV